MALSPKALGGASGTRHCDIGANAEDLAISRPLQQSDTNRAGETSDRGPPCAASLTIGWQYLVKAVNVSSRKLEGS